jgi:hypothetical protein
MNKSLRSVSPIEWLNELSKPYHLTIKDIENIPLNKPINIFCMDRNILDISCNIDHNYPNIPTKPSVFFRKGYCITFTKTEDGIKGKWIFNHDANSSYKKEFDIDIENIWYPLKNDCISDNINKNLHDIKYIGTNYKEFPETTRLGWRGAIMLMNNMDNTGYNIIWNEEI